MWHIYIWCKYTHNKAAKTAAKLPRKNFFATFLQNYLVVWLYVYNFAPEKIQVQAVNVVYGRGDCITPHRDTTETNGGRTFNVCKKTLKCVH